MSYSYSQEDKTNLEWFKKDISARSLVSIELQVGSLRGLYPCKMEMEYPISVIAGKNGSGKSTLLAMACCAFHNGRNGYISGDRLKTYYTFSDFFVQTADEVKVEGVAIRYGSVGRWIYGKNKKVIEGIGYQKKIKKRGGKWDKYEKRPNRNVVFLGIQRIVPPSERKTERTYSGKFTSVDLEQQTKNEILEISSRVLGRRYTSLDMRTVNRRKLFVVDRKSKHYSGFNMGAGENAIFSLLIELFSAGKNSLIVVDEIELGLHEEAQKRLIYELKKLCVKLHCQIICSTHSASIIDAVPPEGRFFVEAGQDSTEITRGISSVYAMGRLNGGESKEIVVYTEDDIGKAIVEGCLPQYIRERIHIEPIGSDQAVLKQLSARYREKKGDCIAFLDGDKRAQDNRLRKQVYNHLESRNCEDIDQWLNKRLFYLPGEVWPEKFLINSAQILILKELAETWRVKEENLDNILDMAMTAGKHKELYNLSMSIAQNKSVILIDIIRMLAIKCQLEFSHIENSITNLLQEI